MSNTKNGDVIGHGRAIRADDKPRGGTAKTIQTTPRKLIFVENGTGG